MKHILLTVTLLFLASAVQAYTAGNKTVSKVHIHSSSGIYFATEEDFLNPYNCSQTGLYKLSPGSQYEKEMYSLLLAARMAKQKITFHISSTCSSNYVMVTWINTHD